MNYMDDYNDLLNNYGYCCNEEKNKKDIEADALSDISNKLVSIVNTALSINEDLVSIATAVAAENCCKVPCDIYELLCCIQKSVNEINCSSSQAAKCLKGLFCELVEL